MTITATARRRRWENGKEWSTTRQARYHHILVLLLLLPLFYLLLLPPPKDPAPRHLIFTASFLAFYPIAGYAPYNPSKAALRSMSDTLSQEMHLHAGSHPNRPPIKVHTVFPAAILTESYEAENRIKTDLTKMLEEVDDGQTPAEVARAAIRGLETGHEIINTDIMTRFFSCAMLGTSVRGGFWRAWPTISWAVWACSPL